MVARKGRVKGGEKGAKVKGGKKRKRLRVGKGGKG
jgi:hypothetical protein